MPHKCFACDKPLTMKTGWITVTCADEQDVFVGSTCNRRIVRGGKDGWQPPKGGPRLYSLAHDPKRLRRLT